MGWLLLELFYDICLFLLKLKPKLLELCLIWWIKLLDMSFRFIDFFLDHHHFFVMLHFQLFDCDLKFRFF